eukprot:358418-Chlamydomonas_euryale.AAC.3
MSFTDGIQGASNPETNHASVHVCATLPHACGPTDQHSARGAVLAAWRTAHAARCTVHGAWCM